MEFEKIQKIRISREKLEECGQVDVVPVFVGVLGSAAKKLGQWIGKLGIKIRIIRY